jgi:hypothetical protein
VQASIRDILVVDDHAAMSMLVSARSTHYRGDLAPMVPKYFR